MPNSKYIYISKYKQYIYIYNKQTNRQTDKQTNTFIKPHHIYTYISSWTAYANEKKNYFVEMKN